MSQGHLRKSEAKRLYSGASFPDSLVRLLYQALNALTNTVWFAHLTMSGEIAYASV